MSAPPRSRQSKSINARAASRRRGGCRTVPHDSFSVGETLDTIDTKDTKAKRVCFEKLGCYDRHAMKRFPFVSLVSFVLTVGVVVAFGSLAPSATEQTWTGQISDSLCGAKHEEAAEGQVKMPDRDCTLACVRGGSKFVLVVDGKMFQIANQDLADLKTHAGHKVKLTGELKGDSITVSKIERQP